MEIYGTLQPKNNINGSINVSGIIQGGTEDFDEKIIPYDNRIMQNTNNIASLNSRVGTNETAIESINERVSDVEEDLLFLENNKADKTEIPNVPTWALSETKPTYTSSEITNASNVEGTKVTNALNNLNVHINAISDEVDENIQSISNLGTSVNNISRSVGELTTSVNGLSSTVEEHTTTINQLNQSLANLNLSFVTTHTTDIYHSITLDASEINGRKIKSVVGVENNGILPLGMILRIANGNIVIKVFNANLEPIESNISVTFLVYYDNE